MTFSFSVVFYQNAPYTLFPKAVPPYYRVRYDASVNSSELAYPVSYILWFSFGIKTLRAVIVHQHGCGEGSCPIVLTGAYDLDW